MRIHPLAGAILLAGFLAHDDGVCAAPSTNLTSAPVSPAKPHHPLRDYKFVNELGQPVSLADFQGQALGITFFFTRCPMPNFCPRLSKNFQEASRQLSANYSSFTNWHFLSVTFDPEFDTPAVLKDYAERYEYDPRHWSFLTGPREKINELMELSGVKTESDGASINHNFRTMIIDTSNRMQMVFPITGDLSDAIVGEMLKAGGVSTNAVAASAVAHAGAALSK